MNPACEICKGACCEGLRLPRVRLHTVDATQWFNAHGDVDDTSIYLPCQCKHLKDGMCSIYPTRFDNCKQFKVGGDSCLWAIQHNRSGDQQRSILKAIYEQQRPVPTTVGPEKPTGSSGEAGMVPSMPDVCEGRTDGPRTDN